MPKPTDSLDRYVRAISADRNFDAAAASYMESVVNWRRSLGNFNKVISSGARRRILKNVLYLHFGNATDNPDDGATFERLLNRSNPHHQEGAGEDSCGPRVLRTVIALAERTGHLAVRQGWHDRRLKVLRPTDAWIAQEAERHEAALSSLALLAEDRSRFTARPRGATLVGRLAIAAGRNPRAVGVMLGDPDGAMRELCALDGGMATIFAVADAWGRGRRTPSHKEAGAAFRLSASQARKILRLASDHSLISFDRDGKIADASALTAACRRLVAHEFALYARAVAPYEAAPVKVLVPAVAVERSPEHANLIPPVAAGSPSQREEAAA
jgi:hypothetical protein